MSRPDVESIAVHAATVLTNVPPEEIGPVRTIDMEHTCELCRYIQHLEELVGRLKQSVIKGHEYNKEWIERITTLQVVDKEIWPERWWGRYEQVK